MNQYSQIVKTTLRDHHVKDNNNSKLYIQSFSYTSWLFVDVRLNNTFLPILFLQLMQQQQQTTK